MPLVVMLVFGSMEACNMIFLKETLQTTAYEVARSVVKGENKPNAARLFGQDLLRQRDVKQGGITTDPSNLNSIDPGEYITVVASAPIANNRFSPRWFFGNGDLSAECVMMRE